MPEVAVAGGDLLYAAGAVVEGEMEGDGGVAALRIES